MKYKSNKIVTAVLAILLVIVIAGAAALVGVLSNGFKDWTKFQPDEQTEQTDETADNGGAIIGESVGNGVKLMSAKIPVSEYAANGISPLAETAYTLTATITPSYAANKTVDWSVAFVNPSSSWANGKTVTDYVTVTPTSDGALTATVSCLQAFGEQIIVTVTSRENTDVSASCTVDYAQKITGSSFSFGDVSCTIGGNTAVNFEVASGVDGSGGAANFSYTASDVYTIAETFDISYSVDYYCAETVIPGFSLDTVAFISDIESGEEILFDISFLQTYCTSGMGSAWGSGLGMIFVHSVLDNDNPAEAFHIDITINAAGVYSDYSYETSIYIGGMTNNTVISDISLNESAFVF